MEEEKKWEMPALVSEVEDEEKEWGTEKWDSAGKRDVQYPKIPVYCGGTKIKVGDGWKGGEKKTGGRKLTKE